MLKKLCIIGNPNSGKTTMFNLLTHSHGDTGNWHGVTVEKQSKVVSVNRQQVVFIDLPGFYSIRKDGSIDERHTSQFLLEQDYDVILNVIDITSFERALYTTVQLLEIGKPVVLILNKSESIKESQANAIQKVLSEILRIPVYLFSQNYKKKQIRAFTYSIVDTALRASYQAAAILSLHSLYHSFTGDFEEVCSLNPNLSLYVFFQNIADEKKIGTIATVQQQFLQDLNLRFMKVAGEDVDLFLINIRYQIAQYLIQQINLEAEPVKTHDFIDKVLLSRFIGLPIFACVMYAVFSSSIWIGELFKEPFGIIAAALCIDLPIDVLHYYNIHSALLEIILNGIGSGIKTVAEFIPVIGSLYIFLTYLEESGYLARTAFLMNRLFKKIGLHGNSFIPMIIGFSCNVPAIMATRVISNTRVRVATILMLPFISCSARLAVFIIFAGVFFPNDSKNLILALYLVGMFFAGITALLVSKLSSKKSLKHTEDFIIELPDYQIPKLMKVISKTVYKLKSFVLGAGKLICVVCFILHVLHSFSFKGDVLVQDRHKSILVSISKSVTPIFNPIGVTNENWPATVGLITGLLAKEAVIGTLSSLYDTDQYNDYINQNKFIDSIKEAAVMFKENLFGSQENSSNLAADGNVGVNDSIRIVERYFSNSFQVLCYLVFILLYFPCISVFAVTKKEIGTTFAILSGLWTTSVAYSVSSCLYQIYQFQQNHTYYVLPSLCSLSVAVIVMYFIIFMSKKYDTVNNR